MDSPRSFIQKKPYRGNELRLLTIFQQTRSDRRIEKDSINKTREETLFNKQFDCLVPTSKEMEREGASEEGSFWVEALLHFNSK